MNEIKIILCCGAGMSSGFLSNALKKAAKKQKIVCQCSAHAESDITNVIKDGADILCIGPHYAIRLPIYEELCSKLGIAAVVIPKDIYGSLDGAALLKFCIDHLENNK